MRINKLAATEMIKKIPAELRTAARAERKAIIKETKLDPKGASYRISHGLFDMKNNIELRKKIADLNGKTAAAAYEQNAKFIQRQPMGFVSETTANEVPVVHASMKLG